MPPQPFGKPNILNNSSSSSISILISLYCPKVGFHFSSCLESFQTIALMHEKLFFEILNSGIGYCRLFMSIIMKTT